MLKWLLMQLLKGFVCTCWCLRVRIPAICALGARQRHTGCGLCVKWVVPGLFIKGSLGKELSLCMCRWKDTCVNVFLKSTVHSLFVVSRQKSRMYLGFLRVMCFHSVGSVFCLLCVWCLPLTDAGENWLADVYSYNLNTILESHLECLLPYAS